MEALITLYTRATGIEAEKLQMIEDIEAYLTAKEPTAPTYTIQYQKIRLNMSVKVILNESYASPLQANNYTYVKITNKDNLTKPFYFFVKTLNWKSQSCIELDLVLDTLNSFQMGTDYSFSPKTIIQRQHKDRMFAKTFYKYFYEEVELQPTDYTEGSYYVLSKSFTTGYVSFNFTGSSIIFDSSYCYLYLWNSTENRLMTYWEYIGSSSTAKIKFDSILYNSYDDELYLMYDNQLALQGFKPEDFPADIYVVFLAGSSSPDVNHDQDDTNTYIDLIIAEVIERKIEKYVRKVDLMEEGLNPQLYGGETQVIEDKTSNHQNWYLVYNTAGSDVVDAYLVPEENTTADSSSYGLVGGVIYPEAIPSNSNCYILLEKPFYPEPNNDFLNCQAYGRTNFALADGSTIPTYYQDQTTFKAGACLLELKREGNMIHGSVIVIHYNLSSSQTYGHILQTMDFVTPYLNYTGSETSIKYGIHTEDLMEQVKTYSQWRAIAEDNDYTNGYTFATGSSIVLTSIHSLDKTQASLLKIIKMPYIPRDFTISNDLIVLDGNFTLVNSFYNLANVLKLNNLNMDLKHIIDTNEAIKSPNETYMRFNSLGSVVSNRNDFYESKMFHSEFFTPKFTYDSFSFIYKFELEDMNQVFDNYAYDDKYLSISFIMTRTINSRFAFEFTDYIVDKKEDDYPNWLIVARNNEEVIYNSSYLNYIKTGYNYDVKNKQAQATRNWVSVGASLITAVVGLVGSAVSGGATLPLALMGVSGVITSSATITNAISTQAQNERSIQEKLDTLKLQTASVSGSDDVDLMTRYNGNRLLYLTYKVNERVEKLLKDLFYYYGYKDNVSGVPVTNTRYWFNHLKCEPILEFTSINMTQEIEDELKGIMRNGFTIYHKRLVNSVATWDIDQVKENWEVSMLPYLS